MKHYDPNLINIAGKLKQESEKLDNTHAWYIDDLLVEELNIAFALFRVASYQARMAAIRRCNDETQYFKEIPHEAL